MDRYDTAPVIRDRREPVEMMAKFRSAFTSCTVVLKDLTRFGARIEGIDALEIDEAINLGLPGCRPAMAFVAWSGRHGTGLEFAEPLDARVYADLVTRHGLGRQHDPLIAPPRPIN
ncbi:hypothetical protein EDF56_104295 [Novosphingobium sp. PhB165]|uniref:hypothetical protein n=1 Tax=Novosphingobium sp. PhB165 TaxID=2485105 RepID=UPI0010F26E39|nr:hypothetical protein [Novosphingobium sp. PhB165]TCM18763.1 hypothetical protein EDF56_104295 [Novosphingobium sp. PhB165]